MGNQGTKKNKIRKKAEEIVTARKEDNPGELSPELMPELIEELKIHQIELEMQNEELRRTQDELEQSRSKYSDLFDFAPLGYFVFDKNSLILEVNLTGAEQLGIERNGLTGNPFNLCICRDDRDIFTKHLRRVIEKQTRQTCEVRIQRKDKSEFNAQLVSMAVPDNNGEYEHIRTAMMNITEHILAEEELNKHRHHLEELVHDRTDELQSAYRQLEQEVKEKLDFKDEALRSAQLALLGELAAGVAHEINNPVNGIINYAQILINKSDPGKEESNILSRIIKEGDRIAHTVRALLAFARINEEIKAPVHVSEILSEALVMSEAQLRGEGIKLEIDLPPDLPMLCVHPQQVEQVFLNIIINARHALKQKNFGEGELKKLVVAGEVCSVNNCAFVRVTFTDNGVGMSRDILEKVMDPYFTTKPSEEGTGLGLSISHGIISDHRGKMAVDSIEGQYTKVTLELPTVI